MFGFLHSLDWFCRSVAIAMVSMFLSPVVNVSLFYGFQRLHKCLDFLNSLDLFCGSVVIGFAHVYFCVAWICLLVGSECFVVLTCL